MTNANSIFWAAMRQRDILGGLAIFIGLNSALFAIIILASDISSGGQVALAIFAVLSNFLVWLWNDAGIKDVQAGSKDITGDDAETAGVRHSACQFGIADALHAALHDRMLDAAQFGETRLQSHQSASTIVTLAMPPPSHMVCRP